MIHTLLVPLLAGFLAGVNPYNAPLLRERLRGEPHPSRRVLTETAIATATVAVLAIALAWRNGGFVSGRLTNGLLVLGLFALASAFFSLRPPRRPQAIRVPVGWRWIPRQASDIAYTAGPAWLVALALAMRQLTLVAFIIPFAAAAVGIFGAHVYWTTRRRDRLPEPILPDRPRTAAHMLLAITYGACAVLVLAAYVKLI